MRVTSSLSEVSFKEVMKLQLDPLSISLGADSSGMMSIQYCSQHTLQLFPTDRLDGKYLLLPGETKGGQHSVVAAIDMDSKQKVAIKWCSNVKELKKEEEALLKFRVRHVVMKLGLLEI